MTSARLGSMRRVGVRQGGVQPARFDELPVTSTLAALARHQHGLVARWQIDALGYSPSVLRTRVGAGTLTRVSHGTYAATSTTASALRSATAIALDAPTAVITGNWAAAWWGLRGHTLDGIRGPIPILVPPDANRRVAGAKVHESAHLDERDHVPMTEHHRAVVLLDASERRRKQRGGNLLETRERVPPKAEQLPDRIAGLIVAPLVCTPARTVYELIRRLPPGAKQAERELTRLLDDALASGLVTMDDLDAIARRCSPSRAPGRARIEAVLGPRRGDYVPPDSELEAIALEAFAQWHLPPPVRQMDVPGWAPGRGRVDFAWPDRKVVVEVDGRHHLTEAQSALDADRDRAAQMAGWHVYRYRWRDFHERRAQTRRELRTILLG